MPFCSVVSVVHTSLLLTTCFMRVYKIANSVCPNGTTLLPPTDFYEILYSSIFRKCVEKVHVSLKPDKYVGYMA